MPTSSHNNPGTTSPADQSFPAVQRSRAVAPPASASAVQSSGELQLPGLRPTQAAASPVRGLAVEVMAGNASQVRAMPPEVAETTPPARDVQAGNNRPGGLPINVMIH